MFLSVILGWEAQGRQGMMGGDRSSNWDRRVAMRRGINEIGVEKVEAEPTNGSGSRFRNVYIKTATHISSKQLYISSRDVENSPGSFLCRGI